MTLSNGTRFIATLHIAAFSLLAAACAAPAAEDVGFGDEALTGPKGLPGSSGSLRLVADDETRHPETPSAALDSNGNLYVVYTVRTSTRWSSRLARYDAASGVWTDRLLWDEGGYHPVVRVDPHGGVHVLVSAGVGTPREARYFFSSDGKSMTASTVTSDDGFGGLDFGGDCDMALDAKYRPHVVCSLFDTGPAYFTRSEDGWSVSYLGEKTYGVERALMLFKKGDAARVAIWNAPDGTARPRILGTRGRYAAWDGNRWNRETIAKESLFTGSSSERNSMMVAVSTSDSVSVLTLRDGSGDRLYMSTRTSAGWETTSTGVSTTAWNEQADDTTDTSVFALVEAGAIVGAVGERDGAVHFVRRSGQEWDASALSFGGRAPSAVRAGAEWLVAYVGRGPGVEGALMLARIPR